MRIERTSRENPALLILPEDLGRLDSGLSEIVTTELEYSAHCVDGLERQFESFGELLEYENPPDAAIVSLKIYSFYQRGDFLVSIEFSSSDASLAIWLVGSEPQVEAVTKLLNDRVAGMTPWYGRFVDSQLTGALPVAYGLSLLGVVIATAFMPPTLSGTPFDGWTGGVPLDASRVAVTLAVIVPVTALVITQVVDRLMWRAFPQVFFGLGQGKKRFEHLEKIRWGTLISFVVSVVAGAALMLIF